MTEVLSERQAGNAVRRHSDLAIDARALVKTYGGNVRALAGVSFVVEAGTIFALLGPNGAGKSTTVKILTTLSRPDSGSATVAGHDVLRQPDLVRKTIGCIFQRSGVDRDATGRENLSLQGHVYGLRGSALRRRADELLERFGLSDAAGRVVRTYSGGMQRRLDIAIGLVHRPQVLFLDEPTTGLDPEVRADLWDEISRLCRDEGITIVLTTHYLEEADRLAGRLVIVDRGRVVAEGSPNELKSHLGGDSVQVELEAAAPEPRVLAALGRIDGVDEITVRGRTVRARSPHGAGAVPDLLAALETAGMPAASVSVARPSLDDVYLQYTGRAFDQADREEEQR